MTDTHPSVFIHNEWKSGSGAPFFSCNPANGELLWKGREAIEEDIDLAIRDAKQAFPDWAGLSVNERAQILEEFAKIVERHHSSLAETISKETGKTLWDAKSEVTSMINKVALSIEAQGTLCAGRIKDIQHVRSITRRKPHGTVAVLGPYNFPGHLPHGHIIPALLAGNTVVFKPSELTPLVAEETMKLWQKTSLPPGVLNLVQGGHQTGRALALHPHINGLFFTGSYQTGRYLSEAFGAYPEKILALEMGGNNPLVISKVSDLKAAAYCTIHSTYISSGQRCTCTRRLIVIESPQGDAFIDTLIQMIKSIKVGPYTDIPEPYMGPVISEKYAKKLLESQEMLLQRGGVILTEMKHLKEGTGFLSPGLMDVTLVTHRPDEEIFGPFLQLIRVKNLKEAIEESNNTKYGLVAGLFSDDPEEYDLFYHSVQSGLINWNTPLTGASSAAPFGGIGWSGNHRPSAYYACGYCSYPVASLEKPFISLNHFIPPGVNIDS